MSRFLFSPQHVDLKVPLTRREKLDTLYPSNVYIRGALVPQAVFKTQKMTWTEPQSPPNISYSNTSANKNCGEAIFEWQIIEDFLDEDGNPVGYWKLMDNNCAYLPGVSGRCKPKYPDKKGNPRKLPKAQRNRNRQLRGF